MHTVVILYQDITNVSTTPTHILGDGMATSSEDYKERVWGGGEGKGYATQAEKILFQV